MLIKLEGNHYWCCLQYQSETSLYSQGYGEYDTAEIFGVDSTEVGLARTTPYAVAHAGWVGVQTYIDTTRQLQS